MQFYQAKHVYFPCLHVEKIQAPYGFSGEREGGKETVAPGFPPGSRWRRAVSHPKKPTFPSNPPPKAWESNNSWEDQGEGLGHLPGL